MAEDVVDRDTKDFRFRQLCKFRLSSSPPDLPKQRLFTASSVINVGLTFIGNGTGFTVYRTQHFFDKDKEHSTDRLNYVVTDCPPLARVDVGQAVSHVALSCDDLTIAIATISPLGVAIHLYDIRNFAQKVTGNVTLFHSFTEVVPGPVRDLAWNPGEAATLAVVHSNGQIDVFTDTRRRASLSSAKAMCALDIVWLSTFSFMVAFAPLALDGTQPCVIQMNGSKDGPPSTPYLRMSALELERIERLNTTLSSCLLGTSLLPRQTTLRRWAWSVSTSMGRHGNGGASTKVTEPECPLTDEYADTFPVGFAVDFTSQEQIPLGDDKFHRAEPILLLLTTDGLLIPYHMLYLHNNTQAITSPPRSLTAEVLRLPAASQSAPLKTPEAGNQSTTAVTRLTGAGNQISFGAGSQQVGGSTPAPSFGTEAGNQQLFGAGNQPVASSTQPPPFGAWNQSKSGMLTGFGVTSQASSTASGLPAFGQASSKASGLPSFGQTSLTASGLPAFGQTSSTASGLPSFGQASSTASGLPAFGQASSTASGLPAFGQASSTASGLPSFGQASSTASGLQAFGQASSTASSLPAFGSAGLTNRSGASAPFSFTPSNVSTPVAQPGQPSTNTLQGTGSATLKSSSTTSSGTSSPAAALFTSTQPATTASFGTFAARLDNEGGKASAGSNSFSFMPSAPAGPTVGFGVKTASGAQGSVSSGQSGTMGTGMSSLLNQPVSGPREWSSS